MSKVAAFIPCVNPACAGIMLLESAPTTGGGIFTCTICQERVERDGTSLGISIVVNHNRLDPPPILSACMNCGAHRDTLSTKTAPGQVMVVCPQCDKIHIVDAETGLWRVAEATV